MKKSQLLGALSAGIFLLGWVAGAQAALVSRLGGLAVYDTDYDMTWLANANLAATYPRAC